MSDSHTNPLPEHHMYCVHCGKPFDMRDLAQVIFHMGDHRPKLVHDMTGITVRLKAEGA